MKIIIAFDKFKSCLSALEACQAVREGLEEVLPEARIISLPLSDGGDGFLEVMSFYRKFQTHSINALDPLGRFMKADYLFDPNEQLAVIEMAGVAGLRLLHSRERDCMRTSTYGLGELVYDSIQRGAKHILVGLGGSATNDAGAGMASALGFTFLNERGRKVRPVGGNLSTIRAIKRESKAEILHGVRFVGLTDVRNPMLGMDGAVNVYARQKGASEDDLPELEAGMVRMASLFRQISGKEVASMPGTGAAGGTGAGMVALLGASLCSGSKYMLIQSGMEKHLENADLIITGEGKLDDQSRFGKIPWRLAELGLEKQVNAVAIAGQIDLNQPDQTVPFSQLYALVDKASKLEDSMRHAKRYLKEIAGEIGRKL